MPYPVPIVEIAFDASPYDATPAVWTDVTQWVRSATVDRGRTGDWGALEGSATVVLSNRDRRFDPFNSASPYNGKLRPRKQIRIRATWNSTTYDVFRGFIDGWPPVWTDAGWDSTVTLSCFDALQLLGSSSLPADWSRDYILTLNPRHYYPCDEPIFPFVGGGVLNDYGTSPFPMTIQPAAQNGQELAVGLPSRSVQAANAFVAITDPSRPQTAITNFSVSAWMTADYANVLSVSISNCNAYIGQDQSTGKYSVFIQDYGTPLARTWVTNNSFDSGTGRMLTFTFNVTSKAFQLYVNGTAVATTATTAALGAASVTEAVNLQSGQYQQVLIFDRLLTQTEIETVYKYSTAYFYESPSARVTRIISETPFPASMVSGPTAPKSTVLEITNDAPTAAGELQKVADSEYAPVFVAKNGVVTMFNQGQIFSQTKSIVSQATYGTGGLPIGTEIQLSYDGDSMRNVANVEMSGGGVWIQTNSTSSSAYGEAEEYVSTQVATLDNAKAVGSIVAGYGGNVYPKTSPIEVVLAPSGTWGSTLGLELFDRFTLNVTPPTGAAINIPMLTQRISHEISPERWSTTLEGSARWAAVFIIGTSLIGGTDLLG